MSIEGMPTGSVEWAHATVEVSVDLDASLGRAWQAYADPDQRARWSVPAGEGLVYDEVDFSEDGRDRYRCGTPSTLEFDGSVEYTRISPQELIVYTETVRNAGQPLATGVVVWEFSPTTGGTPVRVTNHVVSFVGDGMIDGTRNGHTKALQQLGDFLTAHDSSP